MFLLLLQMQNLAQPVAFRFKHSKDADREFEAVMKAFGPGDDGKQREASFILIADDYGHRRGFWSDIIEHAARVDMETDIEAQGQQALMQARGQATLNRAMQADPTLKFAGGLGHQGMPHMLQS